MIGRTFIDYYEQLFSCSHPAVSAKLLDAIQPKVTDEMNLALLQAFQTTEIETTLKQMHPLKALGPNGMPSLFINTFGPLLILLLYKLSWTFLTMV